MEQTALQPPTCYFVLSLKSSGSSVLQRALARSGRVRMLRHTPHHENETLYFIKAAAALGLPQVPMENSVIPYSRSRAAGKLRDMVAANLPGWNQPLDGEAAIFAAWSAIVRDGEGDFVEKSPHHLYQPSALALMERYADQASDVVAHFIGLVRNPVATVYSSWQRFGVRPAREERHWLRAYRALHDLKARRPAQVTIVRYEDLVSGTAELPSALQDHAIDGQADKPFHAASLAKWRADRSFGYRPSREVRALAAKFGYSEEDLATPHAGPWFLTREPRALAWSAYHGLPRPWRRSLRSAARGLVN